MLLTGETSRRLAQATEAKAFPFPWSRVDAGPQSGKKKCICIPSSHPHKGSQAVWGKFCGVLSKADSR